MVYIGIKAREKFNDKHKFAMVNRIFEEGLEEFSVVCTHRRHYFNL